MRTDYQEIKEKFERFVQILEKRDGKLEDIFQSDVKCYFSTVKDNSKGECHALHGVKAFLAPFQLPDATKTWIYNYTCRQNGNVCLQAAIVHGVSIKNCGGDFKYCEYSLQFSVQWNKRNDWMISVMRVDMVECEGDYSELIENWYQEDCQPHWFAGVHLPVISGELDSPWLCIVDDESELSDEEQIADAYYEYGFGVDELEFKHLDQALSCDFLANMTPFGNMDKRTFLATLKYQRQRDRYWCHPAKVELIHIEGDTAIVRMYRISGHKQRIDPLIRTEENWDQEYACARYEIEASKKAGRWQLSRLYYFLGLFPISDS